MTKFLGPYFIKPILREQVYPDFSMFEELEKIFSKITPNAIIRGALYMWNKDTGLNISKYREKWKDVSGNPLFVTDAFLSSSKNCDSKIILDNYSAQNHTKTLNYLTMGLGEENIIIDPRVGANDPEHRRELAEKQQMATVGYMHDKFFIISEVSGVGKWVIIQLTANINITQCHQFNNMLIVYDDEILFNQYLKHWNNLKSRIQGKEILELNEEEEIKEVTSVFFFPRKSCPILNVLKKIKINSRVKIDIAMAYLTQPSFRKELVKLKKQGSKIRVLLSEEYQNERSTVDFLKKNKIPVRVISNHGYNQKIMKDEKGKKRIADNWKARMHHKFILIENEHSKTTWTGSYNLTIPGLKLNDETVLKIYDDQVFRRYKKMFNMLWKKEGVLKKVLL
jgi:HKD family nuclease